MHERAISSVGRAIRLHRKGHRFESCIAHKTKRPGAKSSWPLLFVWRYRTRKAEAVYKTSLRVLVAEPYRPKEMLGKMPSKVFIEPYLRVVGSAAPVFTVVTQLV